MLKIDIHAHTSGASRCSRMTVDEYATVFKDFGAEVVTLTNHGNLSDNDEVRLAAKKAGVLFMPGIEISTN